MAWFRGCCKGLLSIEEGCKRTAAGRLIPAGDLLQTSAPPLPCAFFMIFERRSSALIRLLFLQIVQKEWIGEDGVRSVTQYHDVMGAILGNFAKGIVMVRFCQPRLSKASCVG